MARSLIVWAGLALGACSPDVTASVDAVSDDLAVRDTILVPVPDAGGDTGGSDTSTEDTSTSTSTEDTSTSTSTEDTSTSTSTEDTSTSIEDTSTSTSIEDTSTSTSIEDTSTSTSIEDTSTSAETADAVDDDPWAPGDLVYTRVANILATGDLMRVRFHPSGAFALVLGRPNKILYYDAAARALSSLGTLGSTLADLDVGPEGDFVIVGKDGTTATLWVATVDDEGALATTPTTIPTGSPTIVTVEPVAFRADPTAASRFAIGAHGANDSIGYAYLFGVEAGLSPVKGFNTDAGLMDLMWADPNITPGSSAIVTSEGINNRGSHTWVLATDLVVTNGFSPAFGNAGGAHWRPGGAYGVVAGWSSNKLYVYDGAWEMGTLPVPTGASPNAVRWRDARRALVVGRVIASPPYAVVIDVRAGDAAAWPATLVDQSIRDFDEAPWHGNASSMHLLDVDWRPGVACDEGLIVGTPSSQGSFGYAIAFHDGADPACAP
ncbi:MAG: hypothetical protein IT385_06915 [Deltaproteobacteria bacterium]|nr:hypothetical protein [Deltaproteobacteria bacterium]